MSGGGLSGGLSRGKLPAATKPAKPAPSGPKSVDPPGRQTEDVRRARQRMQQAEARTAPAPAKAPAKTSTPQPPTPNPHSTKALPEPAPARSQGPASDPPAPSKSKPTGVSARDAQRQTVRRVTREAEARWNDADHAELRWEAQGLTKTGAYSEYLNVYGRRALRDSGDKAAAELREIARLHREMLPPHERTDADRLDREVEGLIAAELGADHAINPRTGRTGLTDAAPAAAGPPPAERDWEAAGAERFPNAHDGPMRSPEEEFAAPQRSREYLEYRDEFLQTLEERPGGAKGWFAARREAFSDFEDHASTLMDLAADYETTVDGSPAAARIEAEMKQTADALTQAYGAVQAHALPPELAGDLDLTGASMPVEDPSALRTAGDALALGAAAIPVAGQIGYGIKLGAGVYDVATGAYDVVTKSRARYDRALTENLIEAGVDLTDPQAVRDFAESDTAQTRRERAGALLVSFVDAGLGSGIGKLAGKGGKAIREAFGLGSLSEEVMSNTLDGAMSKIKDDALD